MLILLILLNEKKGIFGKNNNSAKVTIKVLTKHLFMLQWTQKMPTELKALKQI